MIGSGAVRPFVLSMSGKLRNESQMRRDQTKDRARNPRLTRRRVLACSVGAVAALALLAACDDEKVEHGKFKLRSGASW